MGQQQLHLIILGVIIVAISISLGVYIFNTMSIASNKDALVSDLNDVSSDAFAYYQRAKLMGGGNGSFTGYIVPPSYLSNDHGDITSTIAADGKSIDFVATSRNGYGTVSATLDDKGKLLSIVFTGDFM